MQRNRGGARGSSPTTTKNPTAEVASQRSKDSIKPNTYSNAPYAPPTAVQVQFTGSVSGMGESLERPLPKSIGEPLEYSANHTGLVSAGISAIAVIIGSGSKFQCRVLYDCAKINSTLLLLWW